MRQRQPCKWPSAATYGLSRQGVVVCLLLVLALAPPARAQQVADRFEYLLVGAMVGGREAETFEVLREGDIFHIPLTALADTCGCEIEDRADGEFIVTPLGAKRIDLAAITERDGIRYVNELFLRAELGTQVEFIEDLYALRFLFPWTPGVALRASLIEEGSEPQVDDLPAPLSLTSVRLNATHSRRPGEVRSLVDSLLNGRVAGGRWRLRADQSFAGATNIQEYAWTRTFDRKLVLAGHQRISLHPLLGSVEMTGLQGAWTNQPLDTFALSSQPSELLPRTLRTATTIVGRGPAAGIAELRIDGIAVQVRTITLNGVYEFLDVQLPSRQSSRIEVYVYDRFDRSAPLEIHDHTRGVSDQLLPAGAALVMGGAGRQGNYIGDLITDRAGAEVGVATGFIQSRYGVSDRLTLEAAVQTRGDQRQALVGLAGSFGRNFVGSAAIATSGGTLGWDVDVQGYFSRWRVTGRSQQSGAGFSLGTESAQHDHYAEVEYRPTDSLDIAIVGSKRYDGLVSTQYVLPAVSWQPTARTWLRARPDLFGRYRFDFSWSFMDTSRLTAAYVNGNANVGVSSSLSRSLLVSVNGEWSERFGTRQAVQASWVGASAWQPGFTAGVRRTRGELGVMLGAQATFGPGVLVSAQFENDPRVNDPLNRRDPRVTIRLHTDLAFARGQVLGASTYALSTTRGAVGGRIRVVGDADVSAEDLEGLPILVDGRAMARTQRGGRFFIGNLRPGIYNIEIDPEGLPIELTIQGAGRRARIEPGAVTGVDFSATREFGFAGRVLLEDQVFPNALVELLDSRGNVVQSAHTDRFGLYRFDGVPVGRYRVRLSAKNAPGADVIWPTREVIVKDFLFGQDLVLRRGDIHELSIPEGLAGGASAGGGEAGEPGGQQGEQQ